MTEGHFDTKRSYVLDNKKRIKELRIDQLLRDVGGVAGGMTCVDLGCGTGTFSLPMVSLVGNEGIVYAVDDSAEMLEHMRLKKPLPNIIIINRDAVDTGLDSLIADFCLIAFLLHEVKQHDTLVAEAFRLLKPGGKLLVVEWRAELDSPGPPRKIRLSREKLNQLFEQAGLSGFEYISWSDNHYAAIGIKWSRSR